MITLNDALFGVSEAAEQTKNFLSFIFRLSAGGEGGAGKNVKEISGFARASPRARPRCESPRNRSVRFGFKPPRTRSVRNQPLRGWKWVRAKVSMSAPCRKLQVSGVRLVEFIPTKEGLGD